VGVMTRAENLFVGVTTRTASILVRVMSLTKGPFVTLEEGVCVRVKTYTGGLSVTATTRKADLFVKDMTDTGAYL
jgi:hypothetical protein